MCVVHRWRWTRRRGGTPRRSRLRASPSARGAAYTCTWRWSAPVCVCERCGEPRFSQAFPSRCSTFHSHVVSPSRVPCPGTSEVFRYHVPPWMSGKWGGERVALEPNHSHAVFVDSGSSKPPWGEAQPTCSPSVPQARNSPPASPPRSLCSTGLETNLRARLEDSVCDYSASSGGLPAPMVLLVVNGGIN